MSELIRCRNWSPLWKKKHSHQKMSTSGLLWHRVQAHQSKSTAEGGRQQWLQKRPSPWRCSGQIRHFSCWMSTQKRPVLERKDQIKHHCQNIEANCQLTIFQMAIATGKTLFIYYIIIHCSLQSLGEIYSIKFNFYDVFMWKTEAVKPVQSD